MFFGIFVLNRVSILSLFSFFKQGIFSWTINSLRDSVDQAVNSFVTANGLDKKEFPYLLLSYTGYGFGLNVLNRVSKIGILS